ncbi:MAG: RnfABCDGE type electron transport complex subunit B [Candidatus Omnitrophica bacterium]|nr:RnfABCDGE type electron transport complex subunit B [Candidatus Omnitrophota bacterium]
MMTQILIPVVTMAALGLTFGAGLAYALKIFGIEVDPKTALIITKLPGANCGACGKAGCAGFADALVKGEAVPSGCPVTNSEARKAIAEILGIEDTLKLKQIAAVRCSGGNKAKDKYVYHGIKSCRAASLVFGGYKACAFGCLGFGDCVEVCPFDAITMGDDGLPHVDPERCTACGNCVKACPKGLFTLIAEKNVYYVACSSTDPGGAKAKVCSASCIACKKCEKACPVSAIKVDANLSRFDYQKCQNIGKCFEVCPTKVIKKR